MDELQLEDNLKTKFNELLDLVHDNNDEKEQELQKMIMPCATSSEFQSMQFNKNMVDIASLQFYENPHSVNIGEIKSDELLNFGKNETKKQEPQTTILPFNFPHNISYKQNPITPYHVLYEHGYGLQFVPPIMNNVQGIPPPPSSPSPQYCRTLYNAGVYHRVQELIREHQLNATVNHLQDLKLNETISPNLMIEQNEKFARDYISPRASSTSSTSKEKEYLDFRKATKLINKKGGKNGKKRGDLSYSSKIVDDKFDYGAGAGAGANADVGATADAGATANAATDAGDAAPVTMTHAELAAALDAIGYGPNQ